MENHSLISQRHYPEQKFNRNKPGWTDSLNDNKLYQAGGILFYDENGFIALYELKDNKKHYTDFGGKFNQDDVNIYGTIARELSEESFQLLQFLPQQIKQLSKKYPPLKLPKQLSTYYSLCIPISEAFKTSKQIDFSPQVYQQAKFLALRECGDFGNRTKLLNMIFIKFSQVRKFKISYRLRHILQSLTERIKITDPVNDVVNELDSLNVEDKHDDLEKSNGNSGFPDLPELVERDQPVSDENSTKCKCDLWTILRGECDHNI